MRKSIYRHYAAEYRAMAEASGDEKCRSELLKFASEWEALADAAAARSKRQADSSAPDTAIPENYPERVAA